MSAHGSWTIYGANGTTRPIPADPFVFWSELQVGTYYSTPQTSHVLWCANSMTCFPATLLDSDTWLETLGATVSGQWRLQQQGNHVRLSLLKPLPQELYPPTTGPSWLRDHI